MKKEIITKIKNKLSDIIFISDNSLKCINDNSIDTNYLNLYTKDIQLTLYELSELIKLLK